MPNSDKCALIAFDNCVLTVQNSSRVRCNSIMLCCSGPFTATKRMVGRVTVSQIASASAASFFPRFT